MSSKLGKTVEQLRREVTYDYDTAFEWMVIDNHTKKFKLYPMDDLDWVTPSMHRFIQARYELTNSREVTIVLLGIPTAKLIRFEQYSVIRLEPF